MTDTVSTESGVTLESFDGVIENAYGRPLTQNKFKDGSSPVPSIKYNASFEKLVTYDAIPEKEMPDKDDILALVNNARKANARQKAMQTALDGAGVIKPTMEDDDELKIASIVKGLIASKKYNEVGARTLAKQMLGLE
jgi:hypothetical protein